MQGHPVDNKGQREQKQTQLHKIINCQYFQLDPICISIFYMIENIGDKRLGKKGIGDRDKMGWGSLFRDR